MTSHNEQRFGDMLRQLAAERGYGKRSVARLARDVWSGRVDERTLRRWLNNEYTPPLESEYLREVRDRWNLDDETYKRLLAAQRVSRNQERVRRISRRRRSGRSDAANGHSIDTSVNLATGLDGEPRAIAPQTTYMVRSVPKSQRAVREAIIAMLDGLPNRDTDDRASFSDFGEHDTIFITSQGEPYALLHEDEERRLDAQGAIVRAMQKGYHVCHVLRLDARDDERSRTVVRNLLQLVRPERGTYRPFVLNRLGLLAPPYDVVILPEQVSKFYGLIAFATGEPRTIGGAIVIRRQEEARLLRQHVLQLLGASHPLWTAYAESEQEQLQFLDRTIAAERNLGDRLLVQDQLPVITRPFAWYRPDSTWARTKRADSTLSPEDLEQLIVRRLDRVAVFSAAMQSGETWLDVVPTSAFRDLALHGVYKLHDFVPGRILNGDERREYFDHVVRLLQDSPGYRLWIVPDDRDDVITETAWMTKGKHTLLLERWRPIDDRQQRVTTVAITERWLVESCREWFEDDVLSTLGEWDVTDTIEEIEAWRRRIPAGV